LSFQAPRRRGLAAPGGAMSNDLVVLAVVVLLIVIGIIIARLIWRS
jgi:hypothetical protein